MKNEKKLKGTKKIIIGGAVVFLISVVGTVIYFLRKRG